MQIKDQFQNSLKEELEKLKSQNKMLTEYCLKIKEENAFLKNQLAQAQNSIKQLSLLTLDLSKKMLSAKKTFNDMKEINLKQKNVSIIEQSEQPEKPKQNQKVKREEEKLSDSDSEKDCGISFKVSFLTSLFHKVEVIEDKYFEDIKAKIENYFTTLAVRLSEENKMKEAQVKKQLKKQKDELLKFLKEFQIKFTHPLIQFINGL